MFDMHIHSKNSHDSKQTLDDICRSAIEKNVCGVAVTDHADMWYFERDNTYECMKNAIAEIETARAKYKDKLEIFCGVEMGGYLFDPKSAESILALTDYDIVLGSVHCLEAAGWKAAYSAIPFDETASEDRIKELLKVYFDKIEDMIVWGGFDVLSHLTCPLRYINGKYKRNVDPLIFKHKIYDILKSIIKKDIALEINSSGINNIYDELMPSAEIIKMYKEFGGELITLASDAHVPQNIANGIPYAKQVLKKLGFDKYYYYRKHKPWEVVL